MLPRPRVASASRWADNWFNLHTSVLLLPAWASDAIIEVPTRVRHSPCSVSALLAPLTAWERFWRLRVSRWFAWSASAWALAYAAVAVFPVHLDRARLPTTGASSLGALLSAPEAITVDNRADEEFVRRMLALVLQPSTLGIYLYTVTLIGAIGYALAPLIEAAAHDDAQAAGAGVETTAEVALGSYEAAPLLRSPDAQREARRVQTPTSGRRTGALGTAARAVRVAWRTCLGVGSLLMLGVNLLPFESIADREVSAMVPSCLRLRETTLRLQAFLQPLHVSNSYGLFRRMTGVGPRKTLGVPSQCGWGGLPPSIVSVPVVVLEGHARMRDDEPAKGGWVEIPFRYTPSHERRAPRRTAPHQPRLDWQMWFGARVQLELTPRPRPPARSNPLILSRRCTVGKHAQYARPGSPRVCDAAALGSYQNQPWLLHLMYKLLAADQTDGSTQGPGGSRAVLALLDVDAYPFKTAPPLRVRATLFHYDFTRVATPWARRIPSAALLPDNCSLIGPFVGGQRCDRWWKRTRVREYLPPLDRSLLENQVVRGQGWPIGEGRTVADPCRAAADSAAREAVLPLPVCTAIVELRRSTSRIRSLVGWHLGTAGGAAFIDGPLTVILGSIVAAASLRRLRLFFRRLRLHRGQVGAR